MPSLVIERGQEKGFSFALRPGATVVVGRDPANQVVISDPAASRRHFQISEKDGVWLIADLGSRNATYVNEERLEREQALAWGDRVQVGETVFSFLEEDPAEKGKTGLAGKDIAGYKILDRIGRGGMGTVYKARQISLNRIVALKLLSSRYANDPSFVEKFVAEARAAAQLNHPNVVQVFDVGTVGGLHFFSMEFMEGGAVQDLLSQSEGSRLHWTEALPLMMDAARGLVFAERHNIVHRDIKPDNLMLTVENKVKIGDLGLAAKSDQAGDGKIFGTPHFIAPEQARGKDVTHAADIYSLGATFYRMVAGRTPFSGETVKEILRAQVNEPHKPLVEEVPDFPPDLSAIVDRMMAKAVEDRYQSASKLLEDLEAFQIEHHIELAGGRKVNKGLLATAAIVILGLAGVVAWQLNKDPEVIEKTTIKEIEKPTTGTVKTPEEIAREKRQEKERNAENEFLKRQLQEPDKEILLAAKDAWLDQAKNYDELAGDARFSGTPAAADATGRAKEIRETLQRLEREYGETVGRARTWWERQEALIDEMLTDGNWTGVLRAATDVPQSAEAQQNLEYVPEAKAYLDGLEGKVLELNRKSLDAALTSAQALLDAGNPSEALSSVSTWERTTRRHAAAHEELAKLADSARDWVTDRSESLKAELEELLIQDQLLYVEVSRSVRRLPAEALTVFNFTFGACAKAIEKRLPEMQTWVYQDRLKKRVEQLQRADTGWSAFVAALGAGEIVKSDEVLVGFANMPAGSRVTLSSSKPVTREGFMLDVAIGPAKAGRPFDWADLLPSKIWEVFLRDRLDRMPGDLAFGLAWAFVEVGHGDAATALLARADSAGAQIDPGARVDLESEIAALTDYASLLLAKDLTPQQRMARVTAWRDTHVFTEAFLLLDGREGRSMPELLPQAERERYVDSWGVRPK